MDRKAIVPVLRGFGDRFNFFPPVRFGPAALRFAPLAIPFFMGAAFEAFFGFASFLAAGREVLVFFVVFLVLVFLGIGRVPIPQ
jgi:hypothetical protein